MPRKYEPREIGISCWQRTGTGGCRNEFNYTLAKGERQFGKNGAYDKLDLLAGRAGWVIGHFDGQGQYACPDCQNTVYEPSYLNVSERSVAEIIALDPCVSEKLERSMADHAKLCQELHDAS